MGTSPIVRTISPPILRQPLPPTSFYVSRNSHSLELVNGENLGEYILPLARRRTSSLPQEKCYSRVGDIVSSTSLTEVGGRKIEILAGAQDFFRVSTDLVVSVLPFTP